MFRVNYGNGQVSQTFHKRSDALRYMQAQRESDRRHGLSSAYTTLERYLGDYEWSKVKVNLDSQAPEAR